MMSASFVSSVLKLHSQEEMHFESLKNAIVHLVCQLVTARDAVDILDSHASVLLSLLDGLLPCSLLFLRVQESKIILLLCPML
ncbi:hypothetical protein OUZ56_012908 [Daphnia magna]|uniref:Uncharacterized protein n=1 Tax=Daphnia magna TaxID=35525 RepID=A0ABQ9Z4D4_9CRUS|nr:hypothetical protein OUZ56_012908 [Daphnia magna]